MTLPRLGPRTVAHLADARPPRADPAARRPRIVHLGIGAFHRAHQAVYTEDAEPEWGICGVTQRSRTVIDQLGPQGCLYTVAARDRDGEQLRVVGAVRELLQAGGDGVPRRIAHPDTAIVTLTVTEKGYRHDPATHRLRSDDAAVAADLRAGTARTPVAQIARGLDLRRRNTDAPPLTVLSCDNLPGNGPMLRGLVHEFAGRLPDGAALHTYIADHVRFPATMVDRIVPATTAADRAQIARRLGVRDEGAVVTEPFSQWVIEDDFAPGPRPAWERAGAILTDDVAPYEQIKLRLLNGSHSAIAYLGALAGHELVADAVAPGSAIAHAARRLMSDDAAHTVHPPAGFDLDGYQEQVLHRFANPALRYRTLQVATDGSQKLPQRLLATIEDRRAAGALPDAATLAVAAWMRFVTARRSDTGKPLPLQDPMADELTRATATAATPQKQVDALLHIRAIFGDDLAHDDSLRGRLTDWLQILASDGAEAAAARVAT